MEIPNFVPNAAEFARFRAHPFRYHPPTEEFGEVLDPEETAVRYYLHNYGAKVYIPRNLFWGSQPLNYYTSERMALARQTMRKNPNFLDQHPVEAFLLGFGERHLVAINNGHKRFRTSRLRKVPCLIGEISRVALAAGVPTIEFVDRIWRKKVLAEEEFAGLLRPDQYPQYLPPWISTVESLETAFGDRRDDEIIPFPILQGYADLRLKNVIHFAR